MGGSASEVLSSPEVSGAVTGAAVGFAVGGPVGAAVGAGVGIAGAAAGKTAAKEQDKRYQAAIDAAKNLTTTSSTDTTSSDKSSNTSSNTSQTTFAAAGKTEKELLDASVSNFKAQQTLVGDAEAQIKANQALENQAQGTVGSVLGGGAFALSRDEQNRINALRGANIDAGTMSVNKMLDDRLANLQADAARRGIRGQAVSQLQTGALAVGAESLDRNTLEANRIAAEQAISMPGQRVGIQAQTAGQFADFADAARQQAIQNRADLQDPVALQQLRDERLRGGVTSETGSSTSTQDQTSSTKGSATGEGAAAILAAQAGSPGQQASGFAGALGTLGAVGQAAGGLAQAKGALSGGGGGGGGDAKARAVSTGKGLELAGPPAPTSSQSNQRLAQAGLAGPASGRLTRPAVINQQAQANATTPIKKVGR